MSRGGLRAEDLAQTFPHAFSLQIARDCVEWEGVLSENRSTAESWRAQMLSRDIVDRFKKKRPVGLMARMALARLLAPEAINQVFYDNAQEQYERKIPFAALTDLMAEVTLCLSPSVNAGFKKLKDRLAASRSCVFGKLERVEPCVTQALVRYSYGQVRAICNQMRMWTPPEIPGYRTKILDGNHLSGTEHRLKEMRTERAAALPGKSLVVLDPRCRAIQDMFPIEDGHAQERTALDDVIETVEKMDLWIADRNFCTQKFLYTIDERRAAFIIRHHMNMVGKVLGRRRRIGETETGRVFERIMTLNPYGEKELQLRRIEIDLYQPTRDGETTVVILTNLPVEIADAVLIAAIYLKRWKIETAFQVLTTTLRCEVRTLCYPRAALFAFATAALVYNAITVIETAIRAEHGPETTEQLSKYYMALEITSTSDGMMVLLEDSDFDTYRTMTTDEFCLALRDVAQHIDLDRYRKTTRGPKKPVKKKRLNKRELHVSVAKVLRQRE
jgi:IS4 transposase